MSLRITGGEFRGRPIQTPPNDRTRPTQARMRQALFNSLQGVIAESQVLDLFAGSGALGFEALSRGAAHCVFVESAKPVAKLIEKNAATLRVQSQIEVVAETVERAMIRVERFAPFDLVLADPPYSGGWEEKILNDLPWERWLKPGGFLCLEWGAQKSQVEELPERLAFLVKIREKNYGDSILTTYRRPPSGDPESHELPEPDSQPDPEPNSEDDSA